MKITTAELRMHADHIITQAKQEGCHVVLLVGPLGAGKTSLVQAMCRTLGVQEEIQSPTFVLLRRYQTTDPVFTECVHIDAYRITDNTLFSLLNMDRELAHPETLICIEWPENMEEVFAFPHILVQLDYNDEDSRSITYTYYEKK